MPNNFLEDHEQRGPEENSPQCIIYYKNTKGTHTKKKMLKSAREECQTTCKDRPLRVTPDFSMETLKSRGSAWLFYKL